jgi:hypothetical protein
MLGKRETIDPKPGDKRQVRRIVNGRFTSPQPTAAKTSTADQPSQTQARTWKGPGDGSDR